VRRAHNNVNEKNISVTFGSVKSCFLKRACVLKENIIFFALRCWVTKFNQAGKDELLLSEENCTLVK
jgi:hypothetical protein